MGQNAKEKKNTFGSGYPRTKCMSQDSFLWLVMLLNSGLIKTSVLDTLYPFN